MFDCFIFVGNISNNGKKKAKATFKKTVVQIPFGDPQYDSLTAALEPALIVFLGVIVGFIVAGMFLPMFSIIGQLSS